MIAGYSARAPLAGRLWFFVQLGLFGAACAALIAVVGRQPYSWLTAASSAIRQHRRGRLLDPDGVPSRSYPLREQATPR